MKEHSPGPWQCKKGIYCTEIRSNLGLEVATITPDWVNNATEKNGALIATAPELLKILEEALADWDDEQDPYRSGWANKARAVIEKARGE